MGRMAWLLQKYMSYNMTKAGFYQTHTVSEVKVTIHIMETLYVLFEVGHRALIVDSTGPFKEFATLW